MVRTMTIIDQAKAPIEHGLLDSVSSAGIGIDRIRRDDYSIVAKLVEIGLFAVAIVSTAAFASEIIDGGIDQTARAMLTTARGVF